MKYPERVEDYFEHIVEAIEHAGQIQQQAPEFVKAHPEIPWLQMRAMRNKVIHDISMLSLASSGAPSGTICPR